MTTLQSSLFSRDGLERASPGESWQVTVKTDHWTENWAFWS